MADTANPSEEPKKKGLWTKLFRREPKPSNAPDPTQQQTLADIARGMQHAVNSAAEMADQQYLRLFELYFDVNEAHQAVPRIMEFKLPDGTVQPVPVISLIPPAGLNLEKVKVKMAIRIDRTETKPATRDGAKDNVTRSAFHVSFAPSKQGDDRSQNVMDVEMEFSAGEAPEGVHRIIEEVTNRLMAKRGQALPPPSPSPAPQEPPPPPPEPLSEPSVTLRTKDDETKVLSPDETPLTDTRGIPPQ